MVTEMNKKIPAIANIRVLLQAAAGF